MSQDVEPTPTTHAPDTKINLEGLLSSDRVLQSDPDKKSFIDKYIGTPTKKIMAGLAIGGTLLAGGFGIGRLAEGTNPEIRPAASSAPAVPGYTESSTPETTKPAASTSASTPETANTNQEVLVQKTSIEAMDAMTVEQFAALPYADRAAYAYEKNPKMAVADAQRKFDSTDVPYYWYTIGVTAMSTKDTTEGAKTLSATTYYTTDKATGTISAEYRAGADNVKTNGGAGRGTNIGYIYVDSGKTQNGPLRDGTTSEYTNVTLQTINNKGDKIGPEKTYQILQLKIKLSDGRTVTAYPSAYSIDGKQSPVEGYPY
jgi:hypothetical protein